MVGTAVVTTQVPAVRKAVHSATAPKTPKKPKRSRLALKKPVEQKAQAIPVCADPIPVVLGTQPIKVSMADPAPVRVPLEDTSVEPQRVTALSGPRAFIYGPLAGVPEPAAWAQMLGGFVVVGATIRYSRRARMAGDGARQA